MRIQPALAVRWTTDREGRTWLFELRSGVRFHDGSPLTADAVREAFERVRLDAQSPGKQLLDNVDSIEATGALGLRIRTAEPDPLLLQRLVHLRVARGVTTQEVVARHVGTGPYRLVKWEPSQRMVLEAFGGYWGERSAVRDVELLDVPPRERLGALERGEIDVTAVPPHSVLAMNPPHAATIVRGGGLQRMFLWMCAAQRGALRNPLSDARVRRAVELAIDRRAVAQALTGEAGRAAFQLVPNGVFGYAADVAVKSQDIATAQRLLGEAGWQSGFELPMMIPNRSVTAQTTAALLSRMLARVGIRPKMLSLAKDEVMAAFDGRATGLLVSFWTYDDGDAGSFLRDCVHTRASGRGLFNPGFSDSAIDRLIDDALRSVDDDVRMERYREVMQRTAEAVPVVPLFDWPAAWGLAPRVVWRPRMDGLVLAADFKITNQAKSAE
jgi:peptide/nickel transport system substrate-binding protein